MFPYKTDRPLILFVLFWAYFLSNDEADPEGGITPHSWCGTRVTGSANRFQELFVFTNSTANVGNSTASLVWAWSGTKLLCTRG